jgi:peptidoglycan pentaglycine glycine transferase (the first glycine)
MVNNRWDQFVIKNKGSFLQSSAWGQFQKALSHRVWSLEETGLKGLVIRRNLPLGRNYLYCSRGPAGQVTEDNFRGFLNQVKEIGRSEKSIFFKIELDKEFPARASLKGMPLKESKNRIQPVKSLILDISRPEGELLAQMHQKTRYNIKLAQRKGVKIEISAGDNPKEVNRFLKLSADTAKRDKFHLHPPAYYRKMLEFLGQEGMIKLFLAKYQNQIIATNLICFFGQTACYLHGASDYNFHHLMAPHLCQWQAILEAKKLGCQYYDFWGIDENKWPGVTRFKKGFNGQEINYPGSFDLVFQPLWYQLYRLAKKVL